MRTKMTTIDTLKKMRPLIQVVFLLLFIGLMSTGKTKLWMGIILITLLLTARYGRFFCGFICPINTLMRPVNWLGRKLGTQKKSVATVFKSPVVKATVFTFFIIAFAINIYLIKMGQKFPLFIVIILSALLITLFTNEKTWHKYLCPWGVLYSLPGRFSKYKIASTSCSTCGLCTKECPTDAISIHDDHRISADPKSCLLCLDCQTSCPSNSISYIKVKKTNK